MPRRPTDRLEDVVAWVLATLALVTAVVAIGVGGAQREAGAERARAEATERTPVRIVLLERANVLPPVDGASAPVPVQVPARWIDRDGAERVAAFTTTVSRAAGTELTKWVDRDGRLVPPPSQVATVTVGAVLTAVGIAVGGWVALLCVWLLVRRWTGVRNAARWAREWRRVEPRWSGRIPE
jgi:hypothetical protein